MPDVMPPHAQTKPQIHERGKPYEVDWESLNNRGEEVCVRVERVSSQDRFMRLYAAPDTVAALNIG